MYIYICTHTYIRIYIPWLIAHPRDDNIVNIIGMKYIHIYIYIYVCIYVYVLVHVYIYMYIYSGYYSCIPVYDENIVCPTCAEVDLYMQIILGAHIN